MTSSPGPHVAITPCATDCLALRRISEVNEVSVASGGRLGARERVGRREFAPLSPVAEHNLEGEYSNPFSSSSFFAHTALRRAAVPVLASTACACLIASHPARTISAGVSKSGSRGETDDG